MSEARLCGKLLGFEGEESESHLSGSGVGRAAAAVPKRLTPQQVRCGLDHRANRLVDDCGMGYH